MTPYYEFSANDELVITKGHNNFTPKEEAKSFHADTYCFDSKPEKECFLQYISSNKVIRPKKSCTGEMQNSNKTPNKEGIN